jgi:hypothetical protein
MANFYSFIVIAPGEVPLPDFGVYLDQGRNVFNAAVDDVKQFLALLESKDVLVLSTHCLDEFDELEPPTDPYRETPAFALASEGS